MNSIVATENNSCSLVRIKFPYLSPCISGAVNAMVPTGQGKASIWKLSVSTIQSFVLSLVTSRLFALMSPTKIFRLCRNRICSKNARHTFTKSMRFQVGKFFRNAGLTNIPENIVLPSALGIT